MRASRCLDRLMWICLALLALGWLSAVAFALGAGLAWWLNR